LVEIPRLPLIIAKEKKICHKHIKTVGNFIKNSNFASKLRSSKELVELLNIENSDQ